MGAGGELTYARVRNQWCIIEAKNLGQVVEVRMLYNQVPLRVIHPIVEVCNCNLDSPIIFVIEFNMPVNSDWAHMVSAANQRWQVAVFGRT